MIEVTGLGSRVDSRPRIYIVTGYGGGQIVDLDRAYHNLQDAEHRAQSLNDKQIGHAYSNALIYHVNYVPLEVE